MVSYKYKSGYVVYDDHSNKIYLSDSQHSNKNEPYVVSDAVCEYEELCAPCTLDEILLTYISSPVCNMKCDYCYEKESFKSGRAVMTAEQHMNVYLQTLKTFPNANVAITLFGGEPLLAKSEILYFLETLDKHCEENSLHMPSVAMITNGTMVDEQICDMFNKYFNGVTFSVDGFKEAHDKYRKYNNGADTYAHVHQNISRLNSSKTFKTACEATITSAFFDDYSFATVEKIWDTCKELQFSTIEFICVFGNDCEDFAIKELDKLDRFAKDLVKIWCEHVMNDEHVIKIPRLVNFLALLSGNKTLDEMRCSAGYSNFAFDSNNNIYPCQGYVGDDDYLMGKVSESGLEFFPTKKGVISKENFPFCKTCVCRKGCSSFCYVTMKEAGDKLPPSCLFNQMIFKHFLLAFVEIMDSPNKSKLVVGAKRLVNA